MVQGTTAEAATTDETNDRPGLEELAESLNGWEEIAVQKTFGFSIDKFEEHGTIGIRALAYVELKREGANDKAAHKAAMDLTLRELVERYPEMDEDNVPDPMATLREDEGKA